MATAKGSKSKINLGFESSFGTAPAAGIGPLPFISYGMVPKQSQTKSKTIRDSINPGMPILGNVDVSGDVVVPLDAICFGHWLKAMFGTDTLSTAKTATVNTETKLVDGKMNFAAAHNFANGEPLKFTGGGVGTGGIEADTVYYVRDATTQTVNLALTLGGAALDLSNISNNLTATSQLRTHTFSCGGDMPSLACELNLTDVAEYHLSTGCRVGGFGFSLGGDNGEIEARLSMIGSRFALGAAAFCTPTAAGVVRPFQNFRASLLVNGAAFALASKLSFKADFDLDSSLYAIGGAGFRSDITQGQTGISGTLSLFYTGSADMLTNAINEQEIALGIRLAEAHGYSLDLTMSEVQLALTGPAVEGPKGIMVDLDWTAYLNDAAGGAALVATLYNNRTTAY